jgi:hypothetical protein
MTQHQVQEAAGSAPLPPAEPLSAGEIVVVVHVRGGVVAGVGAPGRHIPRVRVVVVDDDMEEAGQGVWVEPVTALEEWPVESGSTLARCRDALPSVAPRHDDGVRNASGLSAPTSPTSESGGGQHG